MFGTVALALYPAMLLGELVVFDKYDELSFLEAEEHGVVWFREENHSLDSESIPSSLTQMSPAAEGFEFEGIVNVCNLSDECFSGLNLDVATQFSIGNFLILSSSYGGANLK